MFNAMKRNSVPLCLSVAILLISSFVARYLGFPYRLSLNHAFIFEQGNRVLSVHIYPLLITLSVLLISFIIGMFMACASHFNKMYDGLFMLPASIIGVILSFALPSRLDFQPYAHSGEVVSIGNCFITVVGWFLAFSVYSMFHKKPTHAPLSDKRIIYLLLPLAAFILAFVFDQAISWTAQTVRTMSMNADGAQTAALLGFVLPYAVSVTAGCALSLIHMAAVGRINAHKPVAWTLLAILILFILRPFAPYAVMILFPNEGHYFCATISGYMVTLLAASLLIAKPQGGYAADRGTIP